MRQQLLLWTLILTVALTVGLSGLGYAQTLSGQGNIGNGSNMGGTMALQQMQRQVTMNQSAIGGIANTDIPNLQSTLDDHSNRLTAIENTLNALKTAIDNLTATVNNNTTKIDSNATNGTNGTDGTTTQNTPQNTLDNAPAGTLAGLCYARNGAPSQCRQLAAPATCVTAQSISDSPCNCQPGWTRVWVGDDVGVPQYRACMSRGGCPKLNFHKFTCRKL